MSGPKSPKTMVVGSGGREHALGWKLAQSGAELVFAPGNPGMASLGRCIDVSAEDIPGLVAAAKREDVGLVVVGPEVPLCGGLVDKLSAEHGIAAFGPSAAAAQLEGSKGFTKTLAASLEIPTGRFDLVTRMDEAEAAIMRHCQGGKGVVVKADGLAAGKGVVVAKTPDEAIAAARRMLVDGEFGEAGKQLVIEEMLAGREVSVLAFVDGERVVLLPSAEDHKAVFDGDRGPNTGGMGVCSPAPRGDATLQAFVAERVMLPVVRELAAKGTPFRGLLYAGMMLTANGPMLLEFNCRFGDPETQVIMLRFAEDLLPWLLGAARGRLPNGKPKIDSRTAVSVVLCSEGYPGKYPRGRVITGLENARNDAEVVVFHAGTAFDEKKQVVTSGGRVLNVCGLGSNLEGARKKAYDAVSRISFEGMHFRKDIGGRST